VTGVDAAEAAEGGGAESPERDAGALRVVAVSGSLRDPSTTSALLAGLVDGIADAVGDRAVSRETVTLAPLAVDLAAAATGAPASDAVAAALEAVASADVLVVATPIYRGTYTGLFKLFFDLVHQDALVGTPVLLAAGGGNDQHTLAIDHQLRPLFAFFRAATLPVGVYARPGDFTREKQIDPDGALPAAISRAVTAAAPFLPR
jgi:FMN reductase